MSVTIPVGRGDRPQRRAVAPGHRRVAAIDIGSNSIRQIVADVSTDGTIQVVDEMKAAPRLATGLAANGRLSDLAIRAAIEAVERMATLAKRAGRRARRRRRDERRARRDQRRRLHHRSPARDRPARARARRPRRGTSQLSQRGRPLRHGRRTHGGDRHRRRLAELALSAEGVIERLVSLPFGAIRLTEEFFEHGVTPRGVRKLRESRQRRHSRPTFRDAIGAARSSSAPAERSPTSREFFSRGRESSRRRGRCTRRTSRVRTSSTSSTCCPT